MNAIYPIRLSEHFWVREFRCKGEEEGQPCDCHGAVLVDQRLVDVLEAFRPVFGMPIHITSAYRCEGYNAAVGGHPKSWHRVGCAADITNRALRKNLEAAAFDLGEVVEDVLGKGKGNVIYYPSRGFLHCDVGSRVAELVREM